MQQPFSGKDPLVSFRRLPATAEGFDRDGLDRFAKVLKDQVAKGRGFHVLITGDRELKRLNSQFRGKNHPTDVLSFPSEDPSEDPREDPRYLGDIAVSRHRAEAQAKQFGHSVTHEIQILMLHGLLHLLGMDHERDQGRMADAEAAWRNRLALPAGLIERAHA